MEYNILTGLTKEQLAVLSAASSTPATGAEGDAAAGVEGAAGASAAAGIVLADAVGLLPAALAGVIGEGGAASGAAEAGIGGEAGGAAAAAHEDDDDADKVLESLLEPEEQVAPVGQLDEATAAAILAMTGDANFNAFTYGFFGDAGPADSMSLGGGGGGGIEDLLGELEPEGATTLDGDEAGLGGMNRPAVSDLSEIADFEPLNPAQLASWGSVDTGAGESAALAAAAHGAGAAERVGAAAVPASNVSSAAEGGAVVQEQPAGAEGEVAGDAAAAAAGQASAAAELAADLKGLSLGAGFE
ncbi:hypothetical protein COO60DRAFT_1481899 [Scenedesmus sp. NREL 46B-D3]|nr:hypothetical protein COO60DRAFT_1481899 [Scenedesmus sp. NREL 46B-D3]